MIPRTTKPFRMVENLDLFSFDLTDEDMLALDALDGADPAAAAVTAAGGGGGAAQPRRRTAAAAGRRAAREAWNVRDIS